MKIKKCKFCESAFETRVHNKVYCSDFCRNEYKKKPYKCIVCGVVKRSKHPNRKYCSNKCQHVHQKKASYITLKCFECGIKFERKKSKVKDVKIGHFCSNECKNKTLSAKGEESHRWNTKVVECVNCGNEIKRQRHELKTREKQFCDHECYGKWLSKNVKGPNHHSWRGGSDDYRGPNWHKVSERIRIRDKHTCQECGIKQIKPRLDVHHIIPFRFFDNDHESANEEENLITLCKSCHSKQKSHTWKTVPEIFKYQGK